MNHRNKPLRTLAVMAAIAMAAFGAIAASHVTPPDSMLLLGQLLGQLADPAMLLAGFTPIAGAVREGWQTKGAGSADDDDGSPAIIEIKKLLEDQGRTWKSWRDTNEALIKAKADGKAIGDLEAKLEKVGSELDKLTDLKQQFDDLMVKLARPGGMGGKADDTLAAETKGFNDALRADYQTKGRAAPQPLTVEHYTQYKSALFGLLRHGDMERLSGDERKALSAGSDPDGGYMLPTPTQGRIVQRVYERSVMRQIATVQTISTADLEGIIDNGEAGGGWTGETSSRTETGTPQVGKYRIEAHELYAEPRVTQKLLDDSAIDIEAYLAGKVGDKFARLEGAAYWTGNGVAKPRGLCSYTTAATGDDTRDWGTFEHVKSGANGDFTTTKADPIQDLLGAFRNEYLTNAQWVMRREVRTKIRKLKKGTTDEYMWEPSLQAGQPDMLLGYPCRVDQYMPALATDSLSLAFGDFREAYLIVDRMGVRTLRDPFTAKPYVKFYSTKRSGGAAVNFEAVKFIKFSA